MVILVPLLRLVHLRVSFAALVFGGGSGLDQRRVHDGAAMHHEPRFLKPGFDVLEQRFAETVLFEKMPEFQQGRRIRNLFHHEVQSEKASHGIAVVDRILCPFVGQAEPDLQEIHPQHHLNSAHRTPAFPRRVERADSLHPFRPRDDFIHCFQKLFPFRDSFPSAVFFVAETELTHVGLLLAVAFLHFTTFRLPFQLHLISGSLAFSLFL